MSSLKAAEKMYFERILCMSSGYVLNFTDPSFGELFKRYGVHIHDTKYQSNGPSKAKKLRSFWEQESDALVGSILSELLDSYEAECDLGVRKGDSATLAKSREIVGRLLGKSFENNSITGDGFLSLEFKIPNIDKLPVEFVVSQIIRDRLEEAQSCLRAKAYLSVILMCGSILEAVLLGAAQGRPKEFNQSPASPKRNDTVKPFQDWSLSEFINVANDIGLFKPDVQKFGHGLRDFRNYIHPYEQMNSGFKPDEHTAKVCFQVLKAALASVAGER